MKESDILLKNKISELSETTERGTYYGEIQSYYQELGSTTSIDKKYSLILKKITKLWTFSGKKTGVHREVKNFEQILMRVKNYRDHFIHSFNVFLLGYYFIHKTRIINDRLFRDWGIDLEWMLASTYHDVAYPLQEIESWFNDLFKIFLGFNPDIHFDYLEIVPPIYVDFMKMISGHHLNSMKGGLIREKYTNFDWSLYAKINTEFMNKNHGVLSALMLAYNLYVVQKFGEEEKPDFPLIHLPASHAICLHSINDEIIEFEKHPTAYLLILCDELQDWGRPTKSNRPSFEMTGLDIERINEQDTPQITIHLNKEIAQLSDLKNNLKTRLTPTNKLKIIIKDSEGNELLTLYDPINR